jgi:hypothetical protein
MAISLGKENFGELIDPFNGMQDLSDKILRTSFGTCTKLILMTLCV